MLDWYFQDPLRVSVTTATFGGFVAGSTWALYKQYSLKRLLDWGDAGAFAQAQDCGL